MQIATVSANKAWVASVWYAHDDDWNLYFISRRYRRHSQEIEANPNVAGAIVLPHLKGSGEKVRGLQFSGQARRTQGDEIARAKSLYEAKYELAAHEDLDELKKPDVTFGFYIIEPEHFVLFDEINFPKNPRQEYRLI